MKSILSNDRRCFICERTEPLHKHHIYPGYGNRQRSEKHGCWVYLCPEHHNVGRFSVHLNNELDLKLRKICQRAFEKTHSREEFIQTFGKSYKLQED